MTTSFNRTVEETLLVITVKVVSGVTIWMRTSVENVLAPVWMPPITLVLLVKPTMMVPQWSTLVTPVRLATKESIVKCKLLKSFNETAVL